MTGFRPVAAAGADRAAVSVARGVFPAPLLIVAGISLAESADAIPPFEPLIAFGPEGIESNLTVANYRQLAEGCLRVYARSLGYAALDDAAVPADRLSRWRSRSPARPRAGAQLLLFLVMLPFWTSFLIRVYAWIALLQPSGLINRAAAGGRADRRADAAALQRVSRCSWGWSIRICRS